MESKEGANKLISDRSSEVYICDFAMSDSRDISETALRILENVVRFGIRFHDIESVMGKLVGLFTYEKIREESREIILGIFHEIGGMGEHFRGLTFFIQQLPKLYCGLGERCKDISLRLIYFVITSHPESIENIWINLASVILNEAPNLISISAKVTSMEIMRICFEYFKMISCNTKRNVAQDFQALGLENCLIKLSNETNSKVSVQATWFLEVLK